MNIIKNYILQSAFKLNQIKKNKIFFETLKKLTQHHYKNCKKYKSLLNVISPKFRSVNNIYDLPFLPVSIFKNYDLFSTDKKNILKTLTSSGTSRNIVSKIYLDKFNALNQTKILSKIVSHYIGNKRCPMLLFESKKTFTNKKLFSARGAAFLGFSIFSNSQTFALNDDGSVNISIIKEFLKKNINTKYIIFGFTFVIWKAFFEEIKNIDSTIKFKNAILIHGGGWKKMESISVTNIVYKFKIKKEFEIQKIHNYYGMVEQTGSVFFECSKCGFFNTHNFSEIIIRDENFNVMKNNKSGIIQLLSILPSSYPGHNLITEDLGFIYDKQDCECYVLGKRFRVTGRVKKAELRGCSDVF